MTSCQSLLIQHSTQAWTSRLKDRGNQWFSEKKYDQALACYSDAIVSPVDTKYQASINSVCIEQHVQGDEGIPILASFPGSSHLLYLINTEGEGLGDLVSCGYVR